MLDDVSTSRPVRVRAWVLALAAFLLVFGSKLLLLKGIASPLPYWDQWDAEALHLYKPYLEGTLGWADLVASHNEHRIFFPRLLALALFELAGQWDPVLQMIVNAAMHALFAAALFLLLSRVVAPGRQVLLLAFVSVTFVVPIGWENTLSGFQSQFYFLMLFSLTALYLFVRSRALSLGWFSALLLCLCAYLSMSSGALTVAAAIPVLLVQLITGVRARSWREFLSVAILVLVTAVMVGLITEVSGHEPYKAHNLIELLNAAIVLSALPLTSIVGTVVVQFPLVWLAVALFRDKPGIGSTVWLMLALAMWVATQILSLAVGRAAIVTASRYLDLLVVGYPVALAALLLLTNRFGALSRFAWLPGVWIFIIMTALVAVGYTASWPGILEKQNFNQAQLARVTAYQETGEMAILVEAPYLHIPYPSAESFAGMLGDRTIGAILHTDIRSAQAQAGEVIEQSLLKGRLATPVSKLRNALLLIGPIIFALGLGLGFLMATLNWRPTPADNPSGSA